MRIVQVLIVTLAFARPVSAAEFVVKAGAPNKVVFTSKAATETFDGKTDRMSGSIVVDPASVGDSVAVRIVVDLASLDTGIGKRNQHMRENHLETDKYPSAVFEGASVRGPSGAALVPGATVVFDVEGTFTLHGVAKRMRVTVHVTARDARTLVFETSFPVTLADHAISRPKFLFLKLGETQAVTVSGVAVAAP
ncbi:MAG TPA: YceI family protein [Candidatus Krumholzibacteria bacterium]|nr:YceI family protein [Candidatus Krumholzibacteria bacterium]